MSAAKIHLKRRRICDFCGKGEETARLLIVSPGDVADICDECVGVCAEVVAEYDAKKAATPNQTGEVDRT